MDHTALIVIVIVALAAVAVYFLARRRRRPPPVDLTPPVGPTPTRPNKRNPL